MGGFFVRTLVQGESTVLELDRAHATPVHWRASPPHLVELTPSADRRSCVVLAVPGAKLGMGRITVKSIDPVGIGVAWFYLTVKRAPEPATDPEPTAGPRLPAVAGGEPEAEPEPEASRP